MRNHIREQLSQD